MPHALLIAEKPDLMRKIQAVYEKHKSELPYTADFLSQRGHLVTLKNPTELDESLQKWSWETLPIEPENYGGWKYKVIDDTEKDKKYKTSKERFMEIQKAVKSGDYDFIIHAGDPDQEGELLVNIVLLSIGNKLPVKRFWTNDLTESHILEALKDLKDDNHDPMLVNLLSAAFARQHSDWRFGMNISRAATLKMGSRVSCGRVKTELLWIVCKREEEIRNFKPSTCYGVKAVYNEGFDGTLFSKDKISDDENASPDQKAGTVWFETKKEAEEAIGKLNDKAEVAAFQAKRVETFAPKLYKLATLQIDAGKKGYDDATTLAVVQKLYEQEYLSYPRTDCEYLSSNENFQGILNALSGNPDYSAYTSTITYPTIQKVRATKKWISDEALKESGHSALRPTTKLPDFDKLTQAEKDIYDMIARRFLAIFLPPIVQDKTQMVAISNGQTFRSSGKTLVDPGFSVIFGTSFNDVQIPVHEKGDILSVDKYEITEKTTTCPSRYTSPELIAVCENPLKFLDDASLKSLGKKLKVGTPATRSPIIRQLIDVDKYLVEKKEKKTTYLVPSPAGEAIIKNLDGLAICRVDMTAQWEEDLDLVRSGKKTLKEIETEMRKSVSDMVLEIKNRDMTPIEPKAEKKIVGICPLCGKDIIESDKGFYCSGYRDGCRTGIFKEAFGQTYDLDDFITLAKGGHIIRNGREFYYDHEQNKLCEKKTASNLICPVCGKNMEETPTRLSCSCGFATQKVICGYELTADDFRKLAEDGETDVINFTSKQGKPFSTQLVLKKKQLEFPKRGKKKS